MTPETLEVRFLGGKRIDVQAGEFTIRTDQAVKAGGEASAPEPFQLFLASIASCAGIFAWNFCQSRDLPAAGLGLRMLCHRDPQSKLIGRIELILNLPEGFPEKHRPSIVRAIELCAVKKHIQDAPEFVTRIED